MNNTSGKAQTSQEGSRHCQPQYHLEGWKAFHSSCMMMVTTLNYYENPSKTLPEEPRVDPQLLHTAVLKHFETAHQSEKRYASMGRFLSILKRAPVPTGARDSSELIINLS